MTTTEKTKESSKGLIRYVLLVVSLPTSPSPAQTCAFLSEILPELATQQDGTAKVGILWEKNPLSTIDMTAKAVEAFGCGVVNNAIYTYRTLHFGLKAGEATCLVAYDKTAKS